jgi:hypothetical protein
MKGQKLVRKNATVNVVAHAIHFVHLMHCFPLYLLMQKLNAKFLEQSCDVIFVVLRKFNNGAKEIFKID